MSSPPSLETPATDLAAQSLWTSLREAIRGTNADYTRIPMRRAVFLLAVPMVLELVLESTFAVVDLFFVGKLGASAVATVGLTETYLFLLYSIARGLAMGVTALVARRVGEGAAQDRLVDAVGRWQPGVGNGVEPGQILRGGGGAAVLGGKADVAKLVVIIAHPQTGGEGRVLAQEERPIVVGQRAEILGRAGGDGRGESKESGGKKQLTMAHEYSPCSGPD